MTGSIAAACVALLLGAGVLLALLANRQRPEALREEAELSRMMRSLSVIQQKNEEVSAKIEKDAQSVVMTKFPWLRKNNTMPNYFLRSGTVLVENNEDYSQGHIAFIDYPTSTGNTVIDCMRDISVKNRMAMSPLMTSKNRILWESGQDNLNKIRERLKFHAGRYVFGACEKLNGSCSYFLILGDPMQLAISSYEYCKQGLDNDMCQGFSASRMTLRDWIIHQGSVLFRQILLNVDICAKKSELNTTVPDDFLFSKVQMPCWLRQKAFLDRYSSLDLTHAVNYIVNHLQQWFAVVGFVDQLEDSLTMFEKVYKLPFRKCKQFDKHEQYEQLSTGNVVKVDNSANSVYQRQWDIYDENDPHLLSDDTYVRDALSADYRIYKAARQLFHRQKQTLTNSVGS